MQPADAVVADVADEQRAVAIEHDAVRLPQLRLRARSAVAAESCDAGAGTVVMMPVARSILRMTWLSRSAT